MQRVTRVTDEQLDQMIAEASVEGSINADHLVNAVAELRRLRMAMQAVYETEMTRRVVGAMMPDHSDAAAPQRRQCDHPEGARKLYHYSIGYTQEMCGLCFADLSMTSAWNAPGKE